MTHSVAGSQWEKEKQVSYTIHSACKKGSKSTAQEELCNLQSFLFSHHPKGRASQAFPPKTVLNQFYVTGDQVNEGPKFCSTLKYSMEHGYNTHSFKNVEAYITRILPVSK